MKESSNISKSISTVESFRIIWLCVLGIGGLILIFALNPGTIPAILLLSVLTFIMVVQGIFFEIVLSIMYGVKDLKSNDKDTYNYLRMLEQKIEDLEKKFIIED